MSIVTDFKSINKILNRQEQKADFEAKNPQQVAAENYMYGWPYNVAMPFELPASALNDWARKMLAERD